MASHRQINVHESSRGHDGRGVRRVHLRTRRSPVIAALAFDLMYVIVGVGSTCPSLR